jgi:hypothetical protein
MRVSEPISFPRQQLFRSTVRATYKQRAMPCPLGHERNILGPCICWASRLALSSLHITSTYPLVCFPRFGRILHSTHDPDPECKSINSPFLRQSRGERVILEERGGVTPGRGKARAEQGCLVSACGQDRRLCAAKLPLNLPCRPPPHSLPIACPLHLPCTIPFPLSLPPQRQQRPAPHFPFPLALPSSPIHF